MSRINPANRSQLNKEIQILMDQSEEMMGFIPNDALIMAKNPELLKSVTQLINTIYSFRGNCFGNCNGQSNIKKNFY